MCFQFQHWNSPPDGIIYRFPKSLVSCPSQNCKAGLSAYVLPGPSEETETPDHKASQPQLIATLRTHLRSACAFCDLGILTRKPFSASTSQSQEENFSTRQ